MDEMKLWHDPVDQRRAKPKTKKAKEVKKARPIDDRPILADETLAAVVSLPDIRCHCGSDLFDIVQAGRRRLGWGRPYQDCMKAECCFCGTAQWTVAIPHILPPPEPSEIRLLTGSYKGRTLSEVWASGVAGQKYIRWMAAEHKSTIWREHANGFLHSIAVSDAGEGVPGGGDDSQQDRGFAERLRDRSEEAGRLLGFAKEATSAGWRFLGCIPADAGGDS